MPKPIVLPIAPRVIRPAMVAAYLTRSETWFAEHRAELEAEGFPKIDPLLGGYDRHAIDRWLDGRSGLEAEISVSGARTWDRPKTRSA